MSQPEDEQLLLQDLAKPKLPDEKLFTPDEIRIVLKWACAYIKQDNTDESIGSDCLFDRELARLKLKLVDAADQTLLGTLNVGFLLGFDSIPAQYPLQKLWDRLKPSRFLDPQRKAAAAALGRFLEEANLVERTNG